MNDKVAIFLGSWDHERRCNLSDSGVFRTAS